MESLVGISQAELDNVAAYIATFVPSSTDQAITYNTTKAFALPYIFVNTPLVSSPATTTFNSIVTVAPPSKGTVSFSYSGNIATASYTPSSNKTGADSFSYLGKGPAGDSSIRTVNITINAPAPVITNPGSMTAASGADINYQIIATNSPTSYSVAAAGLTLSVDSSGLVTGILPSVTSPSSYSVTISASNAGGTDSETFVLTINPPAPLVTNTGAMTASSGATFGYQIIATNTPTSYSVSTSSGLTLSADSSGLVTGTLPTVTSPTSYSVTISASNVTGTDSETFILTINPPAPVVTNPGAMTRASGSTFNYQINATNTPTSYSVTAAGLTLSVDSSGLVTGILPMVTSPTSYSVTISASNVTGTDSETFILTINPPAPVVTNPGAMTRASGSTFNYQINATNTPTSYSVSTSSGLTLSADSSGLVTGTLPTVTSPTSYSVTISASNVKGTDSETFSLTINPPAPVITNPGTMSATAGAAFSYQIIATNLPTSYSVSTSVGLTLGVDSGGLVTGTLPMVGAPTDYSVTISASNVTGTDSQTFTLTVNPAGAPEVTNPGPITAASGANFSYQIIATNIPDSYSVTAAGLTLSVDGGGLVTGTLPTVTSPTSYSITISASNAIGTGSQTFILTVSPPAPVVNDPGAMTAASGANFNYQINATNTPTSYSVVAPGLTLSVSGSGLVSGILPTVASVTNYSVTLNATNGAGTGSQTFVLTVNPLPAPVVTDPGIMTAASGENFSYQIIANNSPTSYSVTAAGLTLSVDGGGLVTGTLPTVTSPVSYSITISASSIIGTGSKTFTLTVNPPTPVVDNPGSITAASGAIFGYQIIATNSPTSYGVSTSAGLTLVVDSGGSVTGTLPIVASPSSYSVTISASNATGSASQIFTLTINPSAPVVTNPGSITGASGAEFSYQIIATNSPTGYGVTASGLALSVDGSGLVTGTLPVVTSQINYSITLTATNVGGSSSQTFILTVNPQAPVASPATMTVPVNTVATLDLAPFITGSVTSISIVVDAMQGTTSVSGTQVTYTPNQDHFGSDEFSYVATGSGGSSAAAVVTITIVGRPDPSKNAIVTGLLTSQIETSKRFAKAQITNFHQRMESLHRSDPAISATEEMEEAGLALTKRNVPGNFYDTSAQLEAVPPNWPTYQAATQNDPSRLLDGDQAVTANSPALWANLLVSALTTSSINLSALAADNGDISSDEESGNIALWGAGNIRLGKRNQNTSKQVDFRTDGASLGFDKRIDEELAIGMGLGYARDKSTIGTDGTENTSNARSLALYGSYLPTPTTFIDLLVGFGVLSLDTSRYVLPADDFAHAQRKGNQIFSSLAVGYEYRVRNFLVSPYGRIDTVSNRLSSSAESGAGSYALSYSSQSWSTSQSVVGLRTESSHLTGMGWLLPHARIEYQRNIEHGQVANLVYADQPDGVRYSIYPMTINSNSVAIGLGLNFEVSNGFKFGLDYQSTRAINSEESAGTEKNHALSFKLSKELGGKNGP